MKRMKDGQKWSCDRCRKETDTLYFAGTLSICGECRDRERGVAKNGTATAPVQADLHANGTKRLSA
jgi:hypothetical protein